MTAHFIGYILGFVLMSYAVIHFAKLHNTRTQYHTRSIFLSLALFTLVNITKESPVQMTQEEGALEGKELVELNKGFEQMMGLKVDENMTVQSVYATLNYGKLVMFYNYIVAYESSNMSQKEVDESIDREGFCNAMKKDISFSDVNQVGASYIYKFNDKKVKINRFDCPVS